MRWIKTQRTKSVSTEGQFVSLLLYKSGAPDETFFSKSLITSLLWGTRGWILLPRLPCLLQQHPLFISFCTSVPTLLCTASYTFKVTFSLNLQLLRFYYLFILFTDILNHILFNAKTNKKHKQSKETFSTKLNKVSWHRYTDYDTCNYYDKFWACSGLWLQCLLKNFKY